MKLKSCPVCKKKVIDVGLYNHIIGKARTEAFKFMLEKRPMDTPHLTFYRRNLRKETVIKFGLNLNEN